MGKLKDPRAVAPLIAVRKVSGGFLRRRTVDALHDIIFILRAIFASAVPLPPGLQAPISHVSQTTRNFVADINMILDSSKEASSGICCRILRTATGCRKEYCSLAVTERMIYTTGSLENQTYVLAFDLGGKLQWKTANGGQWKAGERMPWAIGFAGARSTPTVDGETVYHLSDLGTLCGVKATTAWKMCTSPRFSTIWDRRYLRSSRQRTKGKSRPTHQSESVRFSPVKCCIASMSRVHSIHPKYVPS